MSQYKKLFDKAEVEYITPFLKLWMSFNNWFKKGYKPNAPDKAALNQCKKEKSPVYKKFKRLLEEKSDEGEKFQNALHLFIQGYEGKVGDYLTSEEDEPVIIFKDPTPEEREEGDLSFVSTHEIYFYDKLLINGIIGKTLDNIYRVRCDLSHGSFDIEDKRFQGLVENSYKILYPIMDLILQEEKAFASNVEAVALETKEHIITQTIPKKEEKK